MLCMLTGKYPEVKDIDNDAVMANYSGCFPCATDFSINQIAQKRAKFDYHLGEIDILACEEL